MRRIHFVLGLTALTLLFASVVKLAMCIQSGHWRDPWAIAAAVFIVRLFPWKRRGRRRGIHVWL